MVELNVIFEILSNERRRYMIYYLFEQDRPVSVAEVIEIIHQWEDDPPSLGEEWDRIDNLQLELEHQHLPKTAQVEFIEYLPDERTIQVQSTSPEIDALVTIARIIERPESK